MRQQRLRIVMASGILLMLLIGVWPTAEWNAVAAQLPAQSSRPTLTPMARPTLTPTPEATPRSPGHQGTADIRWSQVLSDVQHLEQATIFSVSVRGTNMGSAAGNSGAVLHYDPRVLRLLDVMRFRSSDWVRAHDEAQGQITLVLGNMATGERVTMRLRFLALMPTNTAIRLKRDDEQDRANPLFLSPGSLSLEPIQLTGREYKSLLVITGRGYKPSEQLSLWANAGQDQAVEIDGAYFASGDDDGNINLTLPALQQEVESIIVYGRASEVVGTIMIHSESEN
jgi:hypothetical protein